MLHELLEESARRHPDRIALEAADGGLISYGDLAGRSDRIRARLEKAGVHCGDRVGLHLPKSVEAVAGIFGILKTGAAYVPLDVNAPESRNRRILADADVRVVLADDRHVPPVAAACAVLSADDPSPSAAAGAPPAGGGTAGDPAYILYTSGSTGAPKGVVQSHRAGMSFLDWCSRTFRPEPGDVFSSHAPLHFDLSVLDLFLPLKHGARLVLLGPAEGREPRSLAARIAGSGITVWYSTPTTLRLLTEHGKLERQDLSRLRLVLFAGEVYPVVPLRELRRALPGPRMFNLYGPTETNVCTFHEIPPAIPPDRREPYPIGRTCDHLRSRVVGSDGGDLPPGREGELCISGPSVMLEYRGLPDPNRSAFLIDESGERWYRTGDLVVEGPDGCHIFRGRRDRMIKRRGFRVELGEIECRLHEHPAVEEAAVIGGSEPESPLTAFVRFVPGHSESRRALRQFCAEQLPAYMIPTCFRPVASIPRTSTHKTDYRQLEALERER